jgi:D-amino-acid oxidase
VPLQTANRIKECQIHTRVKDEGSANAKWYAELLSLDPWFKDVVPDVSSLLRALVDDTHCFSQFRLLPKDSLGPDIDSATSFTSVCINTAIYLPWLVSQCLKNKVIFKRAVFKHISEASSPTIHPLNMVNVVVNCTGIGASKLGGIEDKTIIPIRGQIVLVRNDAGKMLNISATDDGEDESCYVMTRAAGGGTILGGSVQKDNLDSAVDPSLAVRIMKRAVQICPTLTGGKGIEHLDIIRHGVGIRPVRGSGTRIEKERIGGVLVVHNYGAVAGYQSSYGCAQDAVDLIEKSFGDRAKL